MHIGYNSKRRMAQVALFALNKEFNAREFAFRSGHVIIHSLTDVFSHKIRCCNAHLDIYRHGCICSL